MNHDPCGCAVDLNGLVELSHPDCATHHRNIKCILHGGDWAIWQCPEQHGDTQRALYAEILRIRQESIRISIEAAVNMALYGSVFLQVDHVPGKASRVTIRPPHSVTIRL